MFATARGPPAVNAAKIARCASALRACQPPVRHRAGICPEAASDAALRRPSGWSVLVGVVQVCSGGFWAAPYLVGAILGGRVLFRFVRICSGLVGSVRGVRGWCGAVPYLVGVILRGRVLVGVVRICSGLVGSVRGVRGRALVGPLCCCGGVTVSRRGAGWGEAWGVGGGSGQIPARGRE